MHSYRGFPSPATPRSTSPHKQHHSYNPAYPPMNNPPPPSRRPSAAQSQSRTEEYSDSESTDGGGTKTERDKLELRREKNRVKQRNLRQRRANHIADLEKNLTDLRAEHAAVHQTCALLQQRESHLQGWVHDLESILFRHGHAAEVDSLRRIWDRDIKRPGPTQSAPLISPVDPLSTLARAASSIPGPSANDGRSLQALPSRPSLSGPTTFTKPYDNPYPTPEIAWGSQMNEWMHMPDVERKRKRDSMATADYPSFDSRPSSRGHMSMSGRLSESNVHILPPIQSYHQSAPAVRPLSAPHSQPSMQSATPSSTSTSTHNLSPRSIRITDLLSPRVHPADPISASSAALSPSWRGDRDISVITKSSPSAYNAETPTEIWFEQQQLSTTYEQAPTHEVLSNERGTRTISKRARVRSGSREGDGFEKEHQGHITTTIVATRQGDADPDPTNQRQSRSKQPHFYSFRPVVVAKEVIRPTPHPSVHTARILLISLLPHNTFTDKLTPYLPSLTPPQQTIILTALNNLSPPHVAETFRSWQLRDLSAEDAKTILEYQSSFSADLRLVLFPIAVLRARVINVTKQFPHAFSLNEFINSTLYQARIFGDPLDTDAWELPDEYWDRYEKWFPQGRRYCHSLSEWRRRDGHVGSTVVEMLLGIERDGEKNKTRRVDPVGKPPGWKF